MDSEAQLAVLNERVGKLEAADVTQWEMFEKIRDRLPNWAVWVLTMAGGIIGALLTWLVSCLK